MSEKGLWERSAAWRWMTVLTCLATAAVGLLGPWNKKAPVLPSFASYSPPNPTPGVSPSNNPNSTPSATTPALPGHDPVFDVLVSPEVAGFPPGTELHIVGVYQGALPNGQKEQPWWAKCGLGGSNPVDMAKCHQMYAGLRSEKTITVTVSKSPAPKVIAVMAYEPVKWKIVGADASNVLKIIIGGYYGQDLEGISTTIPAEVYSYEASPCLICSRQNGYFYAYQKDKPEYKQAIDKLRTITGLSPTTFQGVRSTSHFSIQGSHQTVLQNRSRDTKLQSDSVSGQRFVDSISIANVTVPLPEGEWLGIAYARNPSTRGSDELAVLARIEHEKLIELVVLRAQFASDGKGFPRHTACDNTETHAGKVIANEVFGAQSCFWVSHDTAPWGQPIFNLAANSLISKNIVPPDVFVNSVFHKANINSALTVAYLANPDAKNIASQKTAWNASPWHPRYVERFPDKATFIREQVQWASSWFQIFNASVLND